MITDQTYQAEEAKINDLFKQARWNVVKQVNYERIERIADQAMLENIMKDTTTFAFMSFGTAIHGLVGAAFGCIIGGDNVDYRV